MLERLLPYLPVEMIGNKHQRTLFNLNPICVYVQKSIRDTFLYFVKLEKYLQLFHPARRLSKSLSRVSVRSSHSSDLLQGHSVPGSQNLDVTQCPQIISLVCMVLFNPIQAGGKGDN